MESSEMLDVIHVIFEEDLIPSWEHEAEIKDKVRAVIYEKMYGRNYKYGTASAQGRSAEFGNGEMPDIYAPADEGVIKPYFPPTSEDELEGMFGPAMG